MPGILNALIDMRSWGHTRHPKIFISYRRRGEGAGYGGRVADKLVEHFGADQCFRDVDNIESGVDFVRSIQEAVGTCEVLVAVIGPDWTTLKDERGKRRLDDVRDFVRLEVAAALERDIRVIPVLVGGADIPTEHELPDVLKTLSRRQARELTDTRWEYDVTKLAEAIESIGIRRRSRPKQAGTITLNWKVAGAAALGGVTLVALLAAAGAMSALTSDPVSSVVANSAPVDTPDYVHRVGQSVVSPPVGSVYESRTPDVQAPPSNAFTGTVGRVTVTWQHEGVIYNAAVVTSGPRGIAQVQYVHPLSGAVVAVEQDLSLVTNADGAFYVGSNPRLPGTSVPEPLYRPDIFKLAQMDNGIWTITEVGDDWSHLDTALTTQ